jgi:hypothetical protein
MQMNWLKFVPTAIKHDKMMKNCTFCPPHKSSIQQLKGSQHDAQYHIHEFRYRHSTLLLQGKKCCKFEHSETLKRNIDDR